MSRIYHLERYTILSAGFLVCGVISILLAYAIPSSSLVPSTAVLFLAAGIIGTLYVFKNRKNGSSEGDHLLPEIDEREVYILMKSAWAMYELQIVLLLFTALNAGPLLRLIAGDVPDTMIFAVRTLLMGIVIIFLLGSLVARAYFERKI